MPDTEAVYQQYRDMVYGYLFKLCQNHDLADELTQETFFQAFLGFEKFRGACKMKTWLCQIAHNVYVQHVKRETKAQHADLAETELPAPGDMEADCERREMLRAVRELPAEPVRAEPASVRYARQPLLPWQSRRGR